MEYTRSICVSKSKCSQARAIVRANVGLNIAAWTPKVCQTMGLGLLLVALGSCFTYFGVQVAFVLHLVWKYMQTFLGMQHVGCDSGAREGQQKSYIRSGKPAAPETCSAKPEAARSRNVQNGVETFTAPNTRC